MTNHVVGRIFKGVLALGQEILHLLEVPTHFAQVFNKQPE